MSEKILTKLLDYCSKLIKRKRWIFSLEEFYPETSNLHGMNINKKIIKIRLRSPEHYDMFMSWEFILGTFIHELAHMEISGHGSDFYLLMDQLYEEIDDDNNKFLTKLKSSIEKNTSKEKLGGTKLGGTKLGGMELGDKKLGGKKTSQSIKNKMLNAALKRQENNTECKKLGGDVLDGDLKSKMLNAALNRQENNK